MSMQPTNKATDPCPVCKGKGFFPPRPAPEPAQAAAGEGEATKGYAMPQVCVRCGGTGKGGYRTK